jgi:hypothetical protein
MPNPVDAANELHELLSEVLDSVAMGSKLKENIESIRKRVARIAKFLKEVNDNYVPLEVGELKHDAGAVLDLWRKAPAGSITANSKLYADLIDKSETLRTLQSAAIDIVSIRKFSNSEIRLAKALGDRYQEYNPLLYKLVICLNHLSNQIGNFKSKVRYAKVDHRLFLLLQKFNVIDKFKIKLHIHSKDQFVDSTFAKIKSLSQMQNNETLIRFICEKAENQHFVRGDWFNAYAYQIIDDQLGRHNLDYEIFTRVTYNAPPDIIRSGGDFDIIAMVEDKVLLVECKSAGLKQSAERDDFEKIIEKTQVVKKVFDHTRTNHYDYKFLLIYNHFSNDPAEIEQKLEGTGIQPVKLDNIRGTVNELFGSDLSN